jgi:hypothetical protein
MRFSAAIQPHPLLLRTPAAADFLRRLIAAEPSDKAQPAVASPHSEPVLRVAPDMDDLPVDLDQRVRLLGEW